MVFLTVTLASGFVTGWIVAFGLIAVAGTTNWRPPPGGRTGLFSFDLAVFSGVGFGFAVALVASAEIWVAGTNSTFAAGVYFADVLALTTHSTWQTGAFTVFPLGKTD